MREDREQAPQVSVVMPVHNGEAYLKDAVDSILAQTLGDFELVIVDDGSTDATPYLLDGYSDPRIVRIRHESKRGVQRAGNRGLAAARGEYISRFDADDVSLPNRLEAQVAHLDAHRDTALLGSHYYVIDVEGCVQREESVPSHDLDIKWALLFFCPFVQSGAMVRRKTLDEVGYYSECPEFGYVEDYELWSRIADRHGTANLPEPLVSWRDNPAGVSARNRASQIEQGDAIALSNIRRVSPTVALRVEHLSAMRWLLFNHRADLDPMTAIEASRYLLQIHQDFCRRYEINPRLSRTLSRRLRAQLARQLMELAHYHYDRGQRTVAGKLPFEAWRLYGPALLDRRQARLLLKLLVGSRTVNALRRLRAAASHD